jgi:hypothetical protein
MNGFIIECANKPGEIARVNEAIAARCINIGSSASLAFGDRGAIGLVTNNEQATRKALDEAGIGYRQVEVVSVALPDKPGTPADPSRRLAHAGVNVELLMPTRIGGGEVVLAAGVENAAAARDALKELTTVGA